MQVPLHITFRNVPHSDALEQRIREKVEKLDHFYNKITSIKVVVETPHRSHHTGRLYNVRIIMSVPGQEIVVGQAPADEGWRHDPYVAMNSSFDAALRQLQDYVRRFPRRMKMHHERPPHGRVTKLFYEDGGYGFLEAEDGREIYFNRNSVLHDKFDHLQVGVEVRFTEERGDDGPQASSIELVGKNNHLLLAS